MGPQGIRTHRLAQPSYRMLMNYTIDIRDYIVSNIYDYTLTLMINMSASSCACALVRSHGGRRPGRAAFIYRRAGAVAPVGSGHSGMDSGQSAAASVYMDS